MLMYLKDSVAFEHSRCFLNSVVYTLRFTPGFTHNLHHLVHDINALHQQEHGGGKFGKSSSKSKQSSLTNGHAEGSGMDADAGLSQEVIEQLHDLFKSLSCADETADSRDPIQPSSFLNAVSRFNPRFEGNEHQDAHELLLIILNILEDIKIPTPHLDPASTIQSGGGFENGYPHPGSSSSSAQLIEPSKKSKKVGKLLQNGRHGGGGGSGGSINAAANSSSLQNGVLGKAAPSSSGATSLHNGVSVIPPIASQVASSAASGNPTPNFVKENFVGKSVIRCRCLECEASTFRSDTFTNIHVPLLLEDPEDAEEMSGRELVLKQIMKSETLRESNKYVCEECRRKNEAQISVHYENLPKVLVLQLKRFTAASGSSKSYMSKINDYFPTPFTLNCFCAQCMPHTKASASAAGRRAAASNGGTPKHHYRLYAVIMHLGASLASGHYIAYVRALDHVWEYLQCQRGGTVERNKNKKGILKFLRRGNDHKQQQLQQQQEAAAAAAAAAATASAASGISAVDGVAGQVNGVAGSTANGAGQQNVGAGSCRGAHCCGIRSNLNNFSEQQQHYQNLHHHSRQRSVDSADSDLGADGVDGGCASGSSSSSSSADDLWLECDDESIQLITRRQFEEMLSDKQGSTTPYLLFYQRL